jgi:hypothetical protein
MARRAMLEGGARRPNCASLRPNAGFGIDSLSVLIRIDSSAGAG